MLTLLFCALVCMSSRIKKWPLTGLYVSFSVFQVITDATFQHLKGLCNVSAVQEMMDNLFESSFGWECSWSKVLSPDHPFWLVPGARYEMFYAPCVCASMGSLRSELNLFNESEESLSNQDSAPFSCSAGTMERKMSRSYFLFCCPAPVL